MGVNPFYQVLKDALVEITEAKKFVKRTQFAEIPGSFLIGWWSIHLWMNNNDHPVLLGLNLAASIAFMEWAQKRDRKLNETLHHASDVIEDYRVTNAHLPFNKQEKKEIGKRIREAVQAARSMGEVDLYDQLLELGERFGFPREQLQIQQKKSRGLFRLFRKEGKGPDFEGPELTH